MNLKHFTKATYDQLLNQGYRYMLIKKPEKKQWVIPNEYSDVQILKAAHGCEQIPENMICEPIDSEQVIHFLGKRDTTCFVIIPD